MIKRNHRRQKPVNVDKALQCLEKSAQRKWKRPDESDTLTDGEEHFLFNRQLFNSIKTQIDRIRVCEWLKNVAPEQARAHGGTSLVQEPEKAVFGLLVVKVLNKLESTDGGDINHHGPIWRLISYSEGVIRKRRAELVFNVLQSLRKKMVSKTGTDKTSKLNCEQTAAKEQMAK